MVKDILLIAVDLVLIVMSVTTVARFFFFFKFSHLVK